MRSICAAITICATSFLGVALAQDIPADTSYDLALEWKTPASTLNCLDAFRIYTTYTTPGGIPLSPSDAANAALNELLMGVPPAFLASVTDLYTVAQQRADFLDRLAKANSLNTLADPLFLAASNLIQTIYTMVPNGKQSLAAVQASSAQKNYYLAMFQLLNAYPRTIIDQPYANDLEILRACFKIDADRLFKLVSSKVLGAS